MPRGHRDLLIVRARRLSIGLALLLAIGLCSGAATPVVAADTHPTLVQPASTGKAKTTRQAVLKERKTTLTLTPRHPGKTVGGEHSPPPKTIVTKRFLPK